MPPTTAALLDVEEQTTAVVRGRVAMTDLPAFYDRAFGTLAGVLERQGVAVAGPAFARYHGQPAEEADLEVGFPTETPIEPDGDVRASVLPAGRVARVEHVGAYDGLGEAWAALAAWIAEQGSVPSDVMWEVYVTEPNPEMDPAGLRTELTWLLA